MKCDVCGETATNNKRMCDQCAMIIEKVIREVGPDVWNKIPDCKYIYPMVKRVADGNLRTQDIVKDILKGG
jgi:disulfide oxidoreductase YuzD